MKTNDRDRKLNRDDKNRNHNGHHNDHHHHNIDKATISRSLDSQNESHFMDQLTIAATESGHRLNAYLMKLSTTFHRDLRSTCDTFELLMHHFDNDDVVDDDEGSCSSSGKEGLVCGNVDDSCTNKTSPPLRILENPDALVRLHEYLFVVRFLLIQTSASLLTTMDNIVIIKASADAYKKDKQKEDSLFRKKIF